MREYFLASPARAFIAGLSFDQQRRAQECLAALELESDLDGRTKTPIIFAPIVLRLYRQDPFWVIYDLPDDATIQVYAIGWISTPPTIF